MYFSKHSCVASIIAVLCRIVGFSKQYVYSLFVKLQLVVLPPERSSIGEENLQKFLTALCFQEWTEKNYYQCVRKTLDRKN